MPTVIKTLYDKIKIIRQYVIKLNKTSRKGNLGKSKLLEAEELYREYVCEIDVITQRIEKGKLGKETRSLINEVCEQFIIIYKEILELCKSEEKSDSEGNSGSNQSIDSFSSVKSNSDKMEDFNLKTACTLLPVMTGDEGVTNQLIENIELYDTMLKDDHKKHLINFVLKTRLSSNAKLRLSQKYESITALVRDMRCNLLTQKSATSIHAQLQSLRQNSKSIEKFGTEIENLFVDLTISQANGNPDTYNILRPINEKMAIKRFSDGLREPRLSTIIAARDYTALKDAIRAAKDEELSSATPSTSGVSFAMQRGHGRGRGNVRPYYTSRSYPQRNWHWKNRGQNYNRRPQQRGFYRGYSTRGRFNGGRYNHNNRGHSSRGCINHIATDNDTNQISTEAASMNHFFRT